MRVLRRTRAIIWRVRSGDAPPKTPAMRPSLAARLPQELVEMIITYLIYDMRSLRACSLTCYSWYIAAVPHLHRVLLAYVTNTGGQRFRWPDPIQPIYTLGLHPLVKDLRIFGDSDMGSWVTPKLIDRCILSQFKAFVNVRELRIGHLDIPSFMPRIRRYFGHFLPTVQSLTLGSPQGSHRQIIFFIGLFQHLDDLMLHDIKLSSWQVEPVNDVTLIPRFSPPLRGRLVAWHLKRAGLLKDMIELFGGIRFVRMNLFDVKETRFLLKSCAKTLKTVQLHPTDPQGEKLCLNWVTFS